MAVETMNISLPEALKRYVETRVAGGEYGNTSEYIRDLIRHDRDDRLQWEQQRLEALLLEGIESGPAELLTERAWEDLRREARGRLAPGADQGPG